MNHTVCPLETVIRGSQLLGIQVEEMSSELSRCPGALEMQISKMEPSPWEKV